MKQSREAVANGPEAAGRREVTLTVEIRDLTRDDLPGLMWAGGPHHLAAVAKELERAEAGEAEYLALCLRSGIPIAVGGIDFAMYADAGYLWQLAVHPLMQRCGMGTILVGALEDRIRRRGRSRSELRCEAHNSGNVAFYEGLGYTAYGSVTDGWDQQLPSGEVEWYETTCLQMRRDLDRV